MESKSNQTIKGNENVQQNIVQQTNNYIVTGVTEEKARSISEKTSREISSHYFELSQNLANKRMDDFENVVMNKFSKIEAGLDMFADPSFVYQYRNAQIQAAKTDNENDYNLLCQLLIHRNQKKENKFTQTGVDGAIKIVDELSDSVLCGLTILNCIVRSASPCSLDIDEGLQTLDYLYNVIINGSSLPTGYEWLDQLDVLQAIRITPYSSFPKFNEVMKKTLSKYLIVGIEINSDNYAKALKVQCDIGLNLLVTNPLLPSHAILKFSKEAYEDVYITNPSIPGFKLYLKDITPQDKIRDGINSIFDLYENNVEKQKEVQKELISKLDSYKYIKIVSEWWNQLPHACEITSIGRVLGHANAKRCYPDFPPLD